MLYPFDMENVIKCANSSIIDIDVVVPNPRNPNKHTPAQIKMLAKIIKHQGQRLPIIISKRSGFIVSGHGRLEAMKSLGWSKCAVDEQDFATEADEYAHMIADNKIAELAEHDDALMIQQLMEMDFKLDLDLLGIQNFKLEDIDTELKDLKSGEKDFLKQITFIVTDEQSDLIYQAIKKSEELGPFLNDENENKNGNALARIAELFIGNL